MLGLKEKLVGAILGVAMLGATTAAVMQSNVAYFSHAKASAYETILNHNNAPTLSAGEGTIVDSRGITWEYHNASNSSNGHVVLGADSYVGVSHNSSWGITAIDAVTANFTTSQSSEGLWLLKSTDGITWHESEILTSGQETYSVDNWRYIRFYNYTSTIDITSISVGYACSGVSSSEDVDNARVGNVIATTKLAASRETSFISPKSDGGEAIRFTKTETGSTTFTIGFDRAYTFGETAYDKIEFDVWTENVAYGKIIEVLNTDGSYKSSKFTAASGLHVDNPTDSYVWTALGNNWYHAELPVTALVSLISGYGSKDIPVKDIEKKTFNAITLNQGNCVVDNFRIGSSETELGIYNSATYKPSVGEIYWVKTSWVGKLYPSECYITFSDASLARYIPYSDPNLKHESPFYIELLGAGTLTITVHVSCGYNHRVQTISKTITIQ